MKQFTIVAPGNRNQVKMDIWRDAGFKSPVDNSQDNPQPGIDVFLWYQSRQEHLPTWKILSLLPKLVVIVGYKGEHISLPPDLLEIYNQQSFTGRNINFTIGSRLEGRVRAPDWNAYSKGDELLTGEEQIKAAADAIYRFLLEDVIRETAEWCGHMSSVVGHL